MYPSPYASLSRIASGQHGLFHIDQARDQGISDSALKRLAPRVVTRVAAGVYRINGSVDTWEQRALVPVLQSNRGLASHRAAAALWGIDGYRDWRRPEILVPRWSRRPRDRGVIVHESTDLKEVDGAGVDGIPVTTVERTLIDLCAVSGLNMVGTALDDACRRHLTTLEQVRVRFAELNRRGRPGRKKMGAILAHRPGGNIPHDSAFEAMLLRLLRKHGLPEPVCQHPVDIGDTTVFLDFAWPNRLVGVECDSEAYHTEMRKFHWDRERRNRLELRGWAIRNFTWKQVRHRGEWVVDVVRQSLKQAESTNLRQ